MARLPAQTLPPIPASSKVPGRFVSVPQCHGEAPLCQMPQRWRQPTPLPGKAGHREGHSRCHPSQAPAVIILCGAQCKTSWTAGLLFLHHPAHGGPKVLVPHFPACTPSPLPVLLSMDGSKCWDGVCPGQGWKGTFCPSLLFGTPNLSSARTV